MSRKNKNLRWRFSLRSIILSIFLCICGVAVAILINQYEGDRPLGIGCIYFSFVMAFSTYLGNVLPVAYWQWARKICVILLGLPLVAYLWIIKQQNPDISGFLIYSIEGVLNFSVYVFLFTQIILPIIFGRLWCGWSCYMMSIFEIMPEGKTKKGRLQNKRAWPVLVLLAVLVLSFLTWMFLMKGQIQHKQMQLLFWGILFLYYGVGIILAIKLKDNRAFCKYVCPLSVIQKFFSHFALFKLKVDSSKCTRCMKCDASCPMNIRIVDYADARERILSGDCIKCMICRQTCPTSAISTSFGLDCSFNESIRYARRRSHHS